MSEFDWDSLKRRHREKTAGLGDLEVDDYDEGLFDLENRVSALERGNMKFRSLFLQVAATSVGDEMHLREFVHQLLGMRDDVRDDRDRSRATWDLATLALRFEKINDKMIGDLQEKITRLKREKSDMQDKVDEFVKWVEGCQFPIMDNDSRDATFIKNGCSMFRIDILAKLRELGLVRETKED